RSVSILDSEIVSSLDPSSNSTSSQFVSVCARTLSTVETKYSAELYVGITMEILGGRAPSRSADGLLSGTRGSVTNAPIPLPVAPVYWAAAAPEAARARHS